MIYSFLFYLYFMFELINIFLQIILYNIVIYLYQDFKKMFKLGNN